MKLSVQNKIIVVVFLSFWVLSGLFYVFGIFPPHNSIGITQLLIPLSIYSIILLVILKFFLSSILDLPLKQISKAASSMAEGNMKKHVFVQTQDEIGNIAESFNQMSEDMQNKMNESTSTKSRLEAVLLSMFEGVMVVDADGAIILMNQALRQMLSVAEEVKGRKPLEVIRHLEIQKLTEKILKQKQGVETAEFTIFLSEERTLLVHATPVNYQGETQGAVLVFHDITNLRRLEAVRRDFVANVSHELRTPVATIKGYAETLLEGALEDKENARDFVNIIHNDAQHLSRLINELLDLSQIESGNMNFYFKACSVEMVIDRTLKVLNKFVQEHKIKVHINIPKNIPFIWADETSIIQVFLNLIENAVKYNKEFGDLTITATDSLDFVQIKISDSGIGIPQEDLPRIFERFYRVDKAHSRQLGGTGLGLSIVKHLVLAHRGTIDVESSLGVGSTFIVKLPKDRSSTS